MNYDDKFWIPIREFCALASLIDIEQIIDGYDNRSAKNNPDGAYCSIFIGQAKPYGKPIIEAKSSGDDVVTKIGQNKKFEVAFNFYKDGAFEYASSIQGCFYLEKIKKFLRQSRIGISEIKEAIALPKLKSSNYEERASIKIVFFFKDVTEEILPSIKAVDFILNTEAGVIDFPNTDYTRSNK